MSEAQPRPIIWANAGKPAAFHTSSGKAAESADPDKRAVSSKPRDLWSKPASNIITTAFVINRMKDYVMNRRVLIATLVLINVLNFATAQTPRRRMPARPPATKPAPADNSAAKTTAPSALPSPTQPVEVSPATL